MCRIKILVCIEGRSIQIYSIFLNRFSCFFIYYKSIKHSWVEVKNINNIIHMTIALDYLYAITMFFKIKLT